MGFVQGPVLFNMLANDLDVGAESSWSNRPGRSCKHFGGQEQNSKGSYTARDLGTR